MKYIVMLLLFINFSYSQDVVTYKIDYFSGNNLHCDTNNEEAKKLFKIGIETLHMNTMLDKKYLKKTADVFFRAFKLDSTFCDAIFFSGYTYGLTGERKIALGCYYIADSLSNNKSIEFKINLAAEALKVGNFEGMKLARKKYNEVIQFFPESSEGYYGHAITSPEIGDIEKGLENLNIALDKNNFLYHNNNFNQSNFLKGVLLTLNKKYEEGLEYFEMCYDANKKDLNFKIHYSLCLLKVSEIKNDPKMKEKSKKMYNKIDNKDMIPKEIKDLLIF